MIQFYDIVDLFLWSEEVSSKEYPRDSIGKLIKRVGGGRYSAEDIRDYAQTVSCIFSQSLEFGGTAYRCIYGNIDFDRWDCLAVYLASKVVRKRKDYDRVKALCEVVIAAERTQELTDKRISWSKHAQYIGISRQSFMSNWISVAVFIRKELRRLLNKAESESYDQLCDIGALAQDRREIAKR